jgi:hypothetical protein
MFTPQRLGAFCLLIFCVLTTVSAQVEQADKVNQLVNQSVGQKAGPTNTVVTASAGAERVRFTAPSNVVRMQVQIISESGQIVFEVSSKGNVLDWSLQDSNGQRLQGSYLTVVTVKSLSGRLSEKIGSVSVTEKQVELTAVEATGLTAAQQQTVGPIEEQGALTVLKADEQPAVTVVANNGSDGEIIRDRGALSFRIGDFYSGKDTEQMRLTEAGNLGIGTDNPQAKLEVAGTIRTTNGIEFADGTVQTTGLSGRKDKDGNLVPNVGGTGTQNKLAKWTDNSGTLGDSLLSETGGNVVNNGTNIQMTAPASSSVDTNLIFVDANSRTTGMIASATPAYTAGNGPYFAMRGNTYSALPGQHGLFSMSAGNVAQPTGNDGTMVFLTGADQLRMVIKPNGNVGVGTSNPVTKLDVNGDINTATQYNIAGQRLLSNSGTSNLFAGVGAGLNNSGFGFNSFFGSSAGSANTTGNRNSFFGASAGSANTTGAFNSFFGFFSGISNTADHNSFFGSLAGANNTTGGSNSFFGDNAGSSNDTGVNNSFFGTSAGAANIKSPRNSYFGFRGGAHSVGVLNSFFGSEAGEFTTTGSQNSFFGFEAGSETDTGVGNSFFGKGAGQHNGVGTGNTAIGSNSSVGENLTNATAIGADASVTQSNSLVLGTNNVFTPTKVGIGVTAPLATFHVRSLTTSATSNTADFEAPNIGPNQSHIHRGANGDWYIRSAASSGKVILQDTGGNVGIGISSPDQKLTVNGEADKTGGGSWATFSDERLKNIKGRFTSGLKALMQLQPVRYEYKPDNALGLQSSGQHIGFGAQAVQKIIPEAVSKNDRGYLLVNNDPILWTMLNAIKEQQKEIGDQRLRAEQQQQQLQQKRAHVQKLEARLVALEMMVKKLSVKRRLRR